jgi:glycosyltransferase involved in cell wall biosynthesis
MTDIWFWQNILSPHVASLVSELASNGYRVTYVAEQSLSKDRIAQGWLISEMNQVNVIYVQSKYEVEQLVKNCSADSIHISAGLRSIGIVKFAQKELRNLNRKQWVLMESISSIGLVGILKQFYYKQLVYLKFKNLIGILAIGSQTKDWLIKVGFPSEKIYSFAYFLPGYQPLASEKLLFTQPKRFRFIFVGQFIKRKNLKFLIDSLSLFKDYDFEFIVVGSGNLEDDLHSYAKLKLPGKLSWRGKLPQSQVMHMISEADCLVLPSFVDGWGAVVADSLLVGTPAICSHTCGSSNIVKASRVGGVFINNNQDNLTQLLSKQLKEGFVSIEKRKRIVQWSTILKASSGAKYLKKIINYSENKSGSLPDDFLKPNELKL